MRNLSLVHMASTGVVAIAIGGISVAAAADHTGRREAMAAENVTLAEETCGVELSDAARALIGETKGKFTNERAVLANLWRETFLCNPDFAGGNCFAARWQLCQRAYAEYGPEGILVKGLIEAIVKK